MASPGILANLEASKGPQGNRCVRLERRPPVMTTGSCWRAREGGVIVRSLSAGRGQTVPTTSTAGPIPESSRPGFPINTLKPLIISGNKTTRSDLQGSASTDWRSSAESACDCRERQIHIHQHVAQSIRIPQRSLHQALAQTGHQFPRLGLCHRCHDVCQHPGLAG
jgi:hypothetical protein